MSIRRADVRNLVVANVDLKACRFHGAHNLPELRVEGEDLYADGPPGHCSPAAGRWRRSTSGAPNAGNIERAYGTRPSVSHRRGYPDPNSERIRTSITCGP